MKFHGSNFLEVVKDLDGKEIKESPSSDTPLTVKQAIRYALTSTINEGGAPNSEQKFKEFELAMKISRVGPEDTIELSAEDISLIKKKSAILGTEILGFLFLILENK